MLKSKLIGLMGVVPLFSGAAAYAQGEEPESFRVALTADARWVNNANLRARGGPAAEEDGVDELQTVAGLLMLGRLQGRIADFQTNYSLNSRRYSKFPERNDELLLGESTLVMGTADRRHYAELSHSSREFLVDPEASDLPENRDSRTIISVGGYTSMRLGRPNTLSFEASVSDFQFEEATENEATRVSAGADLMRKVSPLSQARINLMAYHLDYRESDDDLDYAQGTVGWRTASRWAEYSAEIGYNVMERAGETVSSPLVRLDWEYQRAGQGVTISAAQRLSDTTQGSGNIDQMDSAVGVDGRVQEIDQFKITDLDLLWSHANPCARCTLSAGLQLQEESYNNFPEFSSREFDLILDAGYNLSSTVTVQLRSLVRYFSAYKDPDSNDYRASRLSLAMMFPEVIRDGAASVFIGVEQRDYDEGAGYSSGYIGARFEYVLLSR